MAGLALGLIAVATASCGSSTPKTASINPTADRAAAKAINLKASDLPGWKQSPNTTTSADQATSSRLAACAGAKSPNKIDVVDVSSPYFDQGQTEVSSDVTMVRSHADGLADLKALTSSKLSGCVQQILVPELNKDLPVGATVSNLQISAFAPSGAPRDSFGLRIALSVTVPQQGAVPINIDTIGFLDGRAEVELDATQTGGDPSTSLEQELLSFLVTRAQQ
jgi:hypothetical protein